MPDGEFNNRPLIPREGWIALWFVASAGALAWGSVFGPAWLQISGAIGAVAFICFAIYFTIFEPQP